MKKRNLNFLLALLAALALVFAGACSDGSDDDTSAGGGGGEYSYTGDYSGTTWVASLHDTDHATSASDAKKDSVDTVTLEFAESGNGVTIAVGYTICAYSANHDSDVTYTEEISATYVDLGTRVGIVLPETGGGSSNSGNDAVEMTFTYTAASGEETAPTLTLAGASNGGTLTYTVGSDDDTDIDIFDATSLAAALEAGASGTEFKLETDSEA